MKDQTYQWPGGARLALSLVVNVEEGAEMNPSSGDNRAEPVDELGITVKAPARNLANESNYQYGIVEGFGRIASVLDSFEVTATWTAAAKALELAPNIAKYIRGRGDEAASHGQRWIHQFRMDEHDERAFIRAAVKSIEATVGKRPVGHLSRYLTTPNTRRILAEEGFRYHMDDYSRDAPFWDESVEPPIVVLPYALDSNDMKMWAQPSYTPSMWLQYATATFDRLRSEGTLCPRMMSLGLHLRVIGRPGRIWALESFLEHVHRSTDVWIAQRRAIADHFAAATAPDG